ncbi:MAG: TetR/AcrR family transcriptional regulator [Lautropia sp.]
MKASTRAAVPGARRLTGAERAQDIVREAVRYFAEVGFDGDTRELARRLGVTQSLLYKYFPTKDALIDRVYEEVYVGRWNPFWESVIRDRSLSIEARLTRLYVEYAKAALTRDWVRIFMFSGLRGEDINRRYLDVLRERILLPIAIELREAFGLPSPAVQPIGTLELELVWSINARVFYFGQRQWIFDVPVDADLDALISMTIEHFVAGARVVLPRLLRAQQAPIRRPG